MKKGVHRHSKWQPLFVVAIALCFLPFAMRLCGLSTGTAATAVILAIAATA
jgi:hypothetical protein